jgi:threonine/homoserine/homoserine lactone efflux protein
VLLLVTSIRWGSLAPLVLTALAIMGSPGPATISLTAAGSAYGVRRSLPYAAGIVVGTTFVLVAVGTGVTAALLAVPGVRPVLIAISVTYILRLAYRVATAPPLAAQSATSGAPTLTGGAVLGVCNPKAWVAIAAVFTTSEVATDATTDALVKIVVLSAIIVVINVSWVVAGAALAPLLRDPARARTINVVLAVTLVGATALAVLG